MISTPEAMAALKHQQRGLKRVNPWTESELSRLRAAYSKDKPANAIDLSALALSLNRHKTNVCRKARELGLTNVARPKVAAEQLKIDTPMFATKEERAAHQSEIQKRRISMNGHPRGALGMKHTAATKERLAATSLERWARMTQAEKDDQVFKAIKAKRDKGTPFPNPRGSWKAAWREVGGQRCFFRSRWEANYARYLEWLRTLGQIESWEHEPQTFWFDGIKRGCVSYLPDFKVVNKGGAVQWHEVKGWMDARSKTVIARMAKYHPREILVVVKEKQYMEIKRKVSSLILGWEE